MSNKPIQKINKSASNDNVDLSQVNRSISNLNTQLAERVKKVNNIAPDSNGNVTIPVPEVDTANLATKTELQAVASGSPKGTYATVGALQSAFPTGNSNIYVVSADGNWYYWNGTAWTSGGQYQSTGIADKSLTVPKTDFLRLSENLFNKNKVTIGSLVNITTGQIVTSDITTAYTTSDFIEVASGETYICNRRIVRIVYFDASKNVLTGTQTPIEANAPLTTPANCKYVRYSYSATAVDQTNTHKMMFLKGNTVPNRYIPHYWGFNNSLDYPIQTSLSSWFRKKGAALGDSNTQNARWQEYVINHFGLEGIENCGIGGTRMSGTSANAMWQDARVNTISTDADFVTIMAGTNDSAGNGEVGTVSIDNVDTTTFIGAFNVCLQKIYARCGVGVSIFLFTPLPAFDALYSANLKNFAIAVKEVGALWSLPIIDLYGKSQLNISNRAVYYSGDGVHINSEGGKKVANLMIGMMKENEVINK